MNGLSKHYSISKILKSFLLAIATQLGIMLSILVAPIFSFVIHLNIVTVAVVLLIIVYCVSLLYKRIYGNFLEWIKYSPIYLMISFLALAPGTVWQKQLFPNVYSTAQTIPLVVQYIWKSISQVFVWAVLICIAWTIVTRLTAFLSGHNRERKLHLEKNGKYPYWLKLLFSLLDGVLMILPIGMLVFWDCYGVAEALAAMPDRHSVINMFGIIGVVFVWGFVTVFVYNFGRLYFTLKIHKTYLSYLSCVFVYAFAGIGLWFFSDTFNPMYYCQLILWDDDLFLDLRRFMIQSHGSEGFLMDLVDLVCFNEKFLAILYVIEWFVAISLVFAVRYIIKRIKARKEGQESNPEMHGEAIHEAETRVCCEQNSTGAEEIL